MKKFKVEATRGDEYEIQVDEDIWTVQELENWSSIFWPVSNFGDLAVSLASSLMRQGIDGAFYEGFGHVKMFWPDGRLRYQIIRNGDSLMQIPAESYCKGIEVKVISYDDEYDFDVTEKY